VYFVFCIFTHTHLLQANDDLIGCLPHTFDDVHAGDVYGLESLVDMQIQTIRVIVLRRWTTHDDGIAIAVFIIVESLLF
jgi:hypothetical protein